MTDQIDVWVAGRARTKGSLRPVHNLGTGQVRLIEEVRESGPWRRAISNAVVREIATPDAGKGRYRLREGFPWDGPVAVSVICELPRENGDTADEPIDIRYGDSDKLLRNVLDALTDAKLYADDRQVIRVALEKRFVSELHPEPGMRIVAWREG